MFIAGCGPNDTQNEGQTIRGVVVETFTYNLEYVTIRGDFTEHDITSGDTVVLAVGNSEIKGKEGEELTLEDVNEGDIVEVLLPETISTSDEALLIIETVIQLKIIDN